VNDIEYQIGSFSLRLPHGHMLPFYQSKFPQYDRFLPHLAKYLPSNKTVIDVGANCADTAAGMLDKNPLLNLLCIEADDLFYDYLTLNISTINQNCHGVNVKLVKHFVGSELNNVVLQGGLGTKKASSSPGTSENLLQSRTLDHIVLSENIDPCSISLIKIDTDGFDYDVINSSPGIIAKSKPLIFFECDCENIHQKEKYEEAISNLSNQGYSSWSIFDNFGALLFQTRQTSQVFDIINYVWLQNQGKSNRTFYYIDIFLNVDEDSELINRVISSY